MAMGWSLNHGQTHTRTVTTHPIIIIFSLINFSLFSSFSFFFLFFYYYYYCCALSYCLIGRYLLPLSLSLSPVFFPFLFCFVFKWRCDRFQRSWLAGWLAGWLTFRRSPAWALVSNVYTFWFLIFKLLCTILYSHKMMSSTKFGFWLFVFSFSYFFKIKEKLLMESMDWILLVALLSLEKIKIKSENINKTKWVFLLHLS